MQSDKLPVINYWDRDSRQHTAHFDHNRKNTLYMVDARGNKFKIKKNKIKKYKIEEG